MDNYIFNLNLELETIINKYASVLSAGAVYYVIENISNKIEKKYYENLSQYLNKENNNISQQKKNEENNISQD